VIHQTRPARKDGWRAASLHCLDGAFRYQKAASKSLYPANFRDLDQEINRLRRSDPDFDRSVIATEMRYRLEWVAYRDKLDLDKPVDRVAAQAKVFAEDPDLYKSHRAATVHVGAR
jgi:hypothetical protein